MKHPKPEKCRELGMLFLMLDSSQPPECKVDMGEATYNHCGTVACHAGWFGIATIKGAPVDDGWLGYSGSKPEEFSYVQGKYKMAEYLGFASPFELEEWAFQNPKLWGNKFGANMFADHSDVDGPSFGKKPTLKKIGLHWMRVGDRIEEFKARA